MAYKFFTGNLNTSGSLNVESAITGNAVRVDTGGVVVAAGNIVASTSQLTASAVSASSAQFGSITVPTLSSTNLDLSGYLKVGGLVELSGNTILGTDSADIVTVKGQLTASQGLSSSLGIQVGGGGTFAGNVTVNGQLNANGAVNLGNGDIDLVKVSGSTTNDIFVVSADVDLLKVSKTNGVQSFGALSGSGA